MYECMFLHIFIYLYFYVFIYIYIFIFIYIYVFIYLLQKCLNISEIQQRYNSGASAPTSQRGRLLGMLYGEHTVGPE